MKTIILHLLNLEYQDQPIHKHLHIKADLLIITQRAILIWRLLLCHLSSIIKI